MFSKEDLVPDPCVRCGEPDPGPVLELCDPCIESAQEVEKLDLEEGPYQLGRGPL